MATVKVYSHKFVFYATLKMIKKLFCLRKNVFKFSDNGQWSSTFLPNIIFALMIENEFHLTFKDWSGKGASNTIWLVWYLNLIFLEYTFNLKTSNVDIQILHCVMFHLICQRKISTYLVSQRENVLISP